MNAIRGRIRDVRVDTSQCSAVVKEVYISYMQQIQLDDKVSKEQNVNVLLTTAGPIASEALPANPAKMRDARRDG